MKWLTSIFKKTWILEKIINNEIEILIGTQLISKGFHFPNLNCIEGDIVQVDEPIVELETDKVNLPNLKKEKKY